MAGGARAGVPEELAGLFVERVNADDLDGLVELYEPDAVLAFPPGSVARGAEQIRAVYHRLLTDRPRFPPGRQQPTLVSGDLALTATRLANGGLTVEVARRQPGGPPSPRPPCTRPAPDTTRPGPH